MNPSIAAFDIDGTLRTVADPWLHLHTHLGTLEHGAAFYRRWLAGEITYSEMEGS
jgi:phosphoserine phosphatase